MSLDPAVVGPFGFQYGTFRRHVLTLMNYTRDSQERVEPSDLEMQAPRRRRRTHSFAHENDPNSPFRHVEHMLGSRYDSDEEEERERLREEEEEKKRRCGNCGIIDYSEPFLYLLCLLTTGGLIYIAVADFSTFMIVVLMYGILCTFVAIWRVRKLGTAHALMESVNDLQAENDRLKNSLDDLEFETGELRETSLSLKLRTSELERENKRFMAITGLLGENVGDLQATKEALMKDMERLDNANMRYEANNLMNLFFLVDRDRGGSLSPEEFEKMNGYIQAVYGVKLDGIAMDKNKDGKVDIHEFVARFEEAIARKAEDLIKEQEGAGVPDLVDIEIFEEEK